MLRFLPNHKPNHTNNHNSCLHCFQHSPKKWNFEDFMIRIIAYSDSTLKESWFSVSYEYDSNWYSKNLSRKIFKTYFICHYYPETIMKKFVQPTCIIIGSEVLYNGPIISGIAHSQERCSFVCTHRQTKETKAKIYIFVYKIYTNNFFKRYTAIAMWCCALAKWSQCKVMPLQIDVVFSYP